MHTYTHEAPEHARRRRRLARTLGVIAVTTVAALSLTSAASAIDDDPEPEPPPVQLRPNLTVTGSVAAAGDAWELRYTVRNVGNAAASAFLVDVKDNGAFLLKRTSHARLEPGASRSELVRIPRIGCYLPVRFTADSTGVVAESSETDNHRWALGLTTTTCPSLPKYKVKAVSFHANDETGLDWTGSDEPYWIFSSVGMPGTARTTASQVFGNVDSGDTRSFGSSEGCIYLSCYGGPAPIGMGISIQVWEEDLGYVNQTLAASADNFQSIGSFLEAQGGIVQWLGKALDALGDLIDYINSWAADDLIGSQTYAYDPVYLASRLPAVGGSFDDTRTYSGGGGEYTMTVRVTRVP
jgi:CARDB